MTIAESKNMPTEVVYVRNGHLRVGFKKLDASDMKRILERLSEEPSSSRPGKSCRYEGVEAILACLPPPQPLRGINFVGNIFIKDEGMSHLHLLPPSVVDLDVSHCGLTSIGIETLCEFMKTNTSITRLMLWGNTIGDDGAHHIGAMLKVNTTLQNLCIAETEPKEHDFCMDGITTKGWACIAKGLKTNRTLRKLSFGNSAFQNRHLLTLGSGLKYNVGLRELDVNTTALSDLALRRYLPLILKHNHTLQKLGSSLPIFTLEEDCITRETLDELRFYFRLNYCHDELFDRRSCMIPNDLWIEALTTSAKFRDPAMVFEFLHVKPDICAKQT